MRELRFRVWSTQDKKMYEAIAIHLFIDLGSMGYEVEVNGRKDTILVPAKSSPKYDQGILEQYTGLCDRNGTKIYEGDIVDSEYHNLKVDVGAGSFEVHMGKGDDSDGFMHGEWYGWKAGENSLLDVSQECTIIGNIHEKPELLESM